jgi:uncharacterized membrane protein YecN with MAPEG domain
MRMVYITAFIASVLTFFYIWPSLRISQMRKIHRISLDEGAVHALEKSIQGNGNFADHVPLSLVLMGLLEINGAPNVLVWVLGCILVLGQYFHAMGMRHPTEGGSDRVIGMKYTFFALALLALSNTVWVGYLFIQSLRFAASVFVH